MRRALAVLAAIAILVAAIAALAPATLATLAVERATAGVATLAGAEGTVWRGSGTLAARGGLRLPFAWTTDPLPLFRGTLRVRVEPVGPTGSPRGTIEVDRAGFTATELDLAVPVAALRALAPRLGIVPEGELRVAAPSLGRSADGWAGAARLEWRHARLAPGEAAPIDFGTVVATLDAAGGRLAGPVVNSGGDVDARGNLAIAANGAPEASLTVVARRDDPALAGALSLLRLAGDPLRVDVPAR